MANFEQPHISERDRARISAFIEEHYGIRMPPEKKQLLEGRLLRRVYALNFSSFEEYFDHVLDVNGSMEYIHFIDLISTHKTEFLRESDHFEFMNRVVLPMLESSGVGTESTLSLWSAGCSTGEEVWSLAVSIEEYLRSRTGSGYYYKILGSDISIPVLEHALRAVYDLESLDVYSVEMRARYFLRSKKPGSAEVRVNPLVRSHARFRAINLNAPDYGMGEQFHVIFCRNVMIYFDRERQFRIIRQLISHLHEDGYLFLGHTETLNFYDFPLKQCGQSVYRKTDK